MLTGGVMGTFRRGERERKGMVRDGGNGVRKEGKAEEGKGREYIYKIR